MHVAGDVDRAALRWRLLNVAVGADEAAGGEQAPRAVLGRRQHAVVVGAFAAVGGADLQPSVRVVPGSC